MDSLGIEKNLQTDENVLLPASSTVRRHDLDALRAIAMLLGIVLHAALAFAPIPWMVQDTQQNSFFYVLFAGIHGFRMPLFFLISGFFTAMLWRKRGLSGLIGQRFKRIFLPLVVGCVTIIPSMWMVSYIATLPSPFCADSPALFQAVVDGNIEEVRTELQKEGTDIDQIDAGSGSTPLCVSVFFGHTEITKLLLDSGADVNRTDQKQTTPFHIAVFVGRVKEAEWLIDAGANQTAIDGNGQTPKMLLSIDAGTTNFFTSSHGVTVDPEKLASAREEIASLMGEKEFLDSQKSGSNSNGLQQLYGVLFYLPVFMHLWFLWFLCWLVAAFTIYAVISKSFLVKSIPKSIVASPFNLLWLIPLTMFAQTQMAEGHFGPEPSSGLLPIPGVLLYYAVFFFFGVVYWDAKDSDCRVGRWWIGYLLTALLLAFPIALDLTSGTFGFATSIQNQAVRFYLNHFLQAIFVWFMIFGCIGLFHKHCSGKNRYLRYVSDSSYWMYLVHLPLVIFGQWLLKDLQIPSFAKFVFITATVFGALLWSYEYMVRRTFVGRFLNGPAKSS